MASDFLAERHPDALIVRELSIGKWGAALLDIAAICEDMIVGVEIKGEGDSGARLERQGWIYSRAASQMFLLTAPALDKAADKHLPAGWWPLRVVDGALVRDNGVLQLDDVKWGHCYGPTWQPNAPAQLCECLITSELRALGKRLVPGHDIGRTVPTMIRAISENAPLAAVRSGVCATLRARDWLKYDRTTGRERQQRYRWADGRPHVGAR
jgi:hypothetical protein